MSAFQVITHRAAICGHVRDAVTGVALAPALVELIGTDVRARGDATGFYSFLDLPDGQYTLCASIPALGTRYGDVTVTGVTVASDGAGRPVLDAKGNLLVPATRVSGVVQHATTAAPIAQAEVKLLASALSMRSNSLGRYSFSAIEAGTHSVRITAPGFVPILQQVTLNPGQSLPANFNLTPV